MVQAMNVVYDVIVLAHLLGMAVLVGGWISTIRAPSATAPMVWGARLQLITGLALVGLAEAVDSAEASVDHTKVGAKLLVSVVVLACVEIARAREKKGEPQPVLVNAAGYLAVLNVAIAALWQ